MNIRHAVVLILMLGLICQCKISTVDKSNEKRDLNRYNTNHLINSKVMKLPVSNRYMTYLRIPFNYCSTCLERELLFLNSNHDKYGDKLIIVTSFIDRRDLFFLKRNLFEKYRVINVDSFSEELDRYSSCYYVSLTKDWTIKKMCFIRKNDKNYSKDFLEECCIN